MKHSDVQLILQQLGLPLIDVASAAGNTEVVLDDDVVASGANDASAVASAADIIEIDSVGAAAASVDSSAASPDMQMVAVRACQANQMVQADAGLSGGRVSVKTLSGLKESDYLGMTHARASVVAAQASKALAKSCRQVAVLKSIKRQLTRQLALRDDSGKKRKQNQTGSLVSMVSTLELTTTASGKRLTATATLALGIRRNLSHIAAGDFGAVLLKDLSASTVLRAEVKTAASVAASMKDHMGHSLSMLREQAGERASSESSGIDLADLAFQSEGWHLLFLSVRADATNSSIWRREKLHVTECEIGMISGSVQEFPADTRKFLRTKRCLRQPQHLDLCFPVCYYLICNWERSIRNLGLSFWWMSSFTLGSYVQGAICRWLVEAQPNIAQASSKSN